MTASLSVYLNSARLHLVARGLICKTESFNSAELHLRSTFRKFTCSYNDETSRNVEKVCNKNGIHLQQGYCWFNLLSFPKKDRQRWVHPSKRRLSYKMDFGKPAATHPELLVHVSINAGSNSKETLVLPTHQHEPKLHSQTCQSISHPESSHTTYTHCTPTHRHADTHFTAHFTLTRCVFYADSILTISVCLEG